MANTAAACEEFSADLSALIDAELSPEREAAVRAHLAGCSGCRERLESLCDIDLELASARVPTVPVDLWERLSARLAEEAAAAPAFAPAARPSQRETHREAAPRRSAPRRRGGLPRPVWSAAVAAAAAAVLYLAVTWSAPRTPLEREPVTAKTAQQAPTPAPEESLASEVPAAHAPLATAPGVDPLDRASEEDLVVVLELETMEDFDVIANLELLEGWLDLEGGASG